LVVIQRRYLELKIAISHEAHEDTKIIGRQPPTTEDTEDQILDVHIVRRDLRGGVMIFVSFVPS
jgi:hypothetical protein